jgi:hypothetical protein
MGYDLSPALRAGGRGTMAFSHVPCLGGNRTAASWTGRDAQNKSSVISFRLSEPSRQLTDDSPEPRGRTPFGPTPSPEFLPRFPRPNLFRVTCSASQSAKRAKGRSPLRERWVKESSKIPRKPRRGERTFRAPSPTCSPTRFSARSCARSALLRGSKRDKRPHA